MGSSVLIPCILGAYHGWLVFQFFLVVFLSPKDFFVIIVVPSNKRFFDFASYSGSFVLLLPDLGLFDPLNTSILNFP